MSTHLESEDILSSVGNCNRIVIIFDIIRLTFIGNQYIIRFGMVYVKEKTAHVYQTKLSFPIIKLCHKTE